MNVAAAPESPPPLLLASSSPRRAELLTRLGLSFEVFPPDVPEDGAEGEPPAEYVERLSGEKVLFVSRRRPDAMVIGGDTVVVLGGAVLGKPRDEGDAVRMLGSLSGRTHTVISGVAVAFPGGTLLSGTAETQVTFRLLGENLIHRYVRTGEPMDKAGGYGIQGLGSALVQEIRGDYHNVMGLPLPLLLRLLEEGGWSYGFGKLLGRARIAE